MYWHLVIFYGFFGNAFWSMAMTSVTNYVSDPGQAGLATSMYSVITNVGVAIVSCLVGPLFVSDAFVAASIVLGIELVALILSFTLRTQKITFKGSL